MKLVQLLNGMGEPLGLYNVPETISENEVQSLLHKHFLEDISDEELEESGIERVFCEEIYL